MVIITEKNTEIEVKIPANFKKETNKLFLKNTETKKEYDIIFTDKENSDLFYIFDYVFDLPVGEYEYFIDGNKGLLRIEDKMVKKSYDVGITFKTYES